MPIRNTFQINARFDLLPPQKTSAVMTSLPDDENDFKFGSKYGRLICYPLFTEAEVTVLSSQAALRNVIPLGWNIPELLSALLISFMQFL